MWADRILGSALADQLVREGRATADELERISPAWRAWAADPDGWFSVHARRDRGTPADSRPEC